MFSLTGAKRFEAEPWFIEAPTEWQGKVTKIVVEPEKSFFNRATSQDEERPNAAIEFAVGKLREGIFVEHLRVRPVVTLEGADYDAFLAALPVMASLEALVVDVLQNPRPRV